MDSLFFTLLYIDLNTSNYNFKPLDGDIGLFKSNDLTSPLLPLLTLKQSTGFILNLRDCHLTPMFVFKVSFWFCVCQLVLSFYPFLKTYKKNRVAHLLSPAFGYTFYTLSVREMILDWSHLGSFRLVLKNKIIAKSS